MDPHAPFDLLRTDGMQIRACEMHQRMHLRSISLFFFFLFLPVLFLPPCSPRLALIFACLLDVPSPARLLAVSLRSRSRREVIFITDHGCHLSSRPRLTVVVRECKYRVARKIVFFGIESIPELLTISKCERRLSLENLRDKKFLRRTKNEIACNDYALYAKLNTIIRVCIITDLFRRVHCPLPNFDL